MTQASTPDLVRLAAGLSKAQRAMLRGRHTAEGNPWPYISITQRAGGAIDRMFRKLQAAGLYDQGNRLTPLGQQVRALLSTPENPHTLPDQQGDG